jgi:Cys-rich protein (TIGR01571 family)
MEEGSFEEPLLGCFKDPGSCVLTAVVPCGGVCLQAKAVSTATEEGFCGAFLLGVCLGCIGTGLNRRKIRKRYNIAGSYAND